MIQQVIVILAGFLLIGAATTFAARMGLRSMEQNYQRLHELVTQNNAKSADMTSMRDAIRDRMLLTYDIVHTSDPFEIDRLAQLYSQKAAQFISARHALLSLNLTSGQRTRLAHQRRLLGSAQKILDSVVAKARAGDVSDAGRLIERARGANERVLDELESMRNDQARLAKAALKQATASYHRSRRRIIFVALFVVALGILVVGFVIWRIVVQGRALANANRALEEANAALEQRVETRTEELMATRAENMRMGAELDVSRRLQQMLLPGAEELAATAGLDVAAFMEPAAEVGGDYYDILPHDEGLRIGIGDVTGHGLESGVVMLMAQSAVRTLAPGTATDIASELQSINHAIYGNIRRMGGDKSLSLAILDYQPPQGQTAPACLRIAGQHESVIIARRGGAIEVVDTDSLGFPVGLVGDVETFVDTRDIELRQGDVVVLFTDGITEAADGQNRLYGVDRLCAVIGRHVNDSAHAITEAIIDDVKAHIGTQTLYDDLTLVVLRQL